VKVVLPRKERKGGRKKTAEKTTGKTATKRVTFDLNPQPAAFMGSSSHGDGSHSLTVRGASSVVGGSSAAGQARPGAGSHVSSRSRRYNRSHAGGSVFVPQNEFPVFSHSGDVEIIVRVASGHENRYLLHRHTLTRCSGFFEASTSNEWSRAQTVPAVPELPAPGQTTAGAIENGPAPVGGGELTRTGDRRGSTDGGPQPMGPLRKRWRYELDTGAENDDIPMLVQKEEERGPPPVTSSIFGGGPGIGGVNGTSSSRHHHKSSGHASHSFFRSVANLSLSTSHHPSQLPPPTQEEEDLLRDYDNLFRIMYNYPPALDSINIADAYVQCKSLLQLADQYDALAVVGPRVDHHLLQFQSRLWRQVAKYPISYLRLGYLARSKVIFQEALIHVVGQWPAGERSIRAALPETVLDIIEDKVDELEETVSRIEARLFRLTLTKGGVRVSPSTSYLDWLAVSLFRQWLADNTTPPPMMSMSAPPVIPDRTRGGGHHQNSFHSRSANNNSRGRNGSNSSSGSSTSAANGGRASNQALIQQQTQQYTQPPLAALGRTYRILGGWSPSAAGSEKSYLSHDECKRFLKLTPEFYNRDNLRKFEKRIDELKALAREVVRPLMGSGLELELTGREGERGGVGIGYLTCTTLADRELPWDVYD